MYPLMVPGLLTYAVLGLLWVVNPRYDVVFSLTSRSHASSMSCLRRLDIKTIQDQQARQDALTSWSMIGCHLGPPKPISNQASSATDWTRSRPLG